MSLPLPDKKKRVPSFEEVMGNKSAPPKVVPSYEEVMGVEKKNPSDNGSSTVSDGGLNGGTSTTEKAEQVPAAPAVPQEETDPISQSLKADELSKRTIAPSEAEMARAQGIPVAAVPDKDAIDYSNKIKSDLKSKGYDADQLASEFKDFPQEAFNRQNTSKEALLQLRQDNPIKYQDVLNDTKNVYSIAKNSNNETANIYNQLNSKPSTSLDDFISTKQAQQHIIDQTLTGDDNKIAQQRLAQNSAKYINANNPDLVNEYQNSPLKDKIDATQYAGLKTEQIFDPEKYKRDLAIASSPEEHSYAVNLKGDISFTTKDKKQADQLGGQETQVSLDNQLGRERVLKQLADMGKENTSKALVGQQYDLEGQYKQAKANGDQETMDNLSQQYLQNQSGIKGIEDDSKNDVQKYPLLSKLMLDEKLKEANQTTDQSVGSYLGNHFLKGFKNSQDTWEDVMTGLMGSDKDNALLQQKRLGETAREQDKMFLPSSLSDSKNLFSKANLYKVAGFTGDVGSFMAQTGLGGGSKVAELATLFNSTYSDAFNQATEEGKDATTAHEEGLVHGGIMMLAGAVSSKYDQVQNMLKDAKSPLAKEIAGVSEDTWNAVVNKNKGAISRISNSVGDVAKEQAKMIGTYGVGTTIAGDLADKGFFNKDISTSQMIDHAATAAKDMAIGGVALAGAGLLNKYRSGGITPLDKINLWEAADNPDITKAQIDESARKGDITPIEADQRKKAVDNLSDLITKVPQQNNKGKRLSDVERTDYLFNSVVKSKADEAAKNLPPKQAEKEEATSQVADFSSQILLDSPTDKQLDTRKTQLEKALIPEKDESGKNIEIPEKELQQTKAELEAVNNEIDKRSKQNFYYEHDEKNPVDNLKDVESTTKALDKIENDNPSKINELVKIDGFKEEELDTNAKIAKEYHEAKNLTPDVRLPEQKKLVKAVEDAIGTKKQLTEQDISSPKNTDNGKTKEADAQTENVGGTDNKNNTASNLEGEAVLPKATSLYMTDDELSKVKDAQDKIPHATEIAINKDGELGLKYKYGPNANRKTGAFIKDAVFESSDKPDNGGKELKFDDNGFHINEPPTDNITSTGEDPEMTKMANAVNDAHIEGKFGIPALDKVLGKLQDTDLQNIYKKVKDKIEKGVINVKNVRERLMTTKEGSESDQAALLYDLADLKGKEKSLQQEIINDTSGKKDALQRELMDVQNDILDNALANRMIGRSASSIFRLRQVWANREGTIEDFKDQYKASKGIKDLTPEQEKVIKDSYLQIRELKAKVEQAREDLEKQKTENETLSKETDRLKKLKTEVDNRKKTEKSKDLGEALKKSQNRVDNAKDNLRKLRGGMNDITRALPATVAEISKIAAEKVYQGVLKFSDLVKSVFNEVRDIFPEWTEKDVRAHLLPDTDTQKYYEHVKKSDLSEGILKEKVAAYNEAQKAYALKMFEWQKDRRSDMMISRPLKERIVDSILRWQRFAVLSYPSTFVKLVAVVAHQLTLKPLKFLIQKAVASLTPKSITDKQSIWGNPTVSALGKYYSALIRNLSLQNLKENFSGIDTKEILHGKGMVYDEFPMGKGLLELPGRSHGYIKSFIKNPEFQFAHEQLTTSAISKMQDADQKLKNNTLTADERKELHDQYDENDVTNEDVMERINENALQHGKWAILMNDNKFVEKFRKWTNDSGITGALIKSELPVLKIPVNYISRAFATKYGLIQAITGRGKKSADGGFPSVVKLIYKGTQDLTPSQSDLIGKTLTLGSIGASFFALGYLNRKNVKQNDDGSYQIFGQHVNKNLIHSPEFESIFSGATTGNEFDKSKNKDTKDFLKSYIEGDADIATKSPFVSMLKYGYIPNVAMALIGKGDFNQKFGKITDATAKKVGDMAIPGFVKQTANAGDVKGGGFHPFGETIKRSPNPKQPDLTRFWETLEESIPGLRENVPVQKPHRK